MATFALTARKPDRWSPASVVEALNLLAGFGISGVLLAAYTAQFTLNELPCPLCMLQRVAFVLALFGFALNVRFGVRPLHYALVLVAACLGLIASGRQVLLNILPNTGGYGSPLFGLHYYTWAFMVFAAIVLGVAVLLLLQLAAGAMPTHPNRGPWATAGLMLAVIVTVANAFTAFAQCGPIECADEPVNWWIASLRH